MIDDKIKTLSEVAQKAHELKKSEKTIGFTNGCFDILHAGHISYLEEAKNACDVLIVGVNSDESVKRIKGKSRPLNSEDDRMKVLASNQSVDFVFKFDEDTPLKSIKQIKPDVLVKGGDWEEDEIVGADFVKSYGGKVLTLSYIHGYSTTSIINSIKKSSKNNDN